MKKSLLLTALLASLMAGCSTTELADSQPLNPPFPELASSTADGSVDTTGLGLDQLRGDANLSKRSVYFEFNLYVVKDNAIIKLN